MGPLDHIKVLDFSHAIAGPFCTKLLAGMGAQVTKIERPGTGDVARAYGPFPGDEPHPEKSGMFLYLNTGKRSIILDLKHPKARRLIRPLIEEADIIVENFRPGVMESFGLGYAALRRTNRRASLISISNFGQTGPYRDYKASDLIAYAAGGYMYTTGANDRAPLKHGGTVAQMMGGLTGLSAAMTALTGRHLTGEGQQVDVSIQEVVASQLGGRALHYSYEGSIPRREPPDIAGFGGVAPCKDGYVYYTTRDPDMLASFTGIDIPEERDSSQVLAAWLKGQDKQVLFHESQVYRLAWAMAQDAEDLLACPQLDARGFWEGIPHPAAGTHRFPGSAMNMTRTAMNVAERAPLLGEHNEEVYCGVLRISRKRLAAFQREGLF